jgi:hypothetical protein
MPKVKFSRGMERSSKIEVINPARRTGRNISPLKIARINTEKLKAIKPSMDFPFFNLIFPKILPIKAENASPIMDIARPTREYLPNIKTFRKMPTVMTEASLKFLLS